MPDGVQYSGRRFPRAGSIPDYAVRSRPFQFDLLTNADLLIERFFDYNGSVFGITPPLDCW